MESAKNEKNGTRLGMQVHKPERQDREREMHKTMFTRPLCNKRIFSLLSIVTKNFDKYKIEPKGHIKMINNIDICNKNN